MHSTGSSYYLLLRKKCYKYINLSSLGINFNNYFCKLHNRGHMAGGKNAVITKTDGAANAQEQQIIFKSTENTIQANTKALPRPLC